MPRAKPSLAVLGLLLSGCAGPSYLVPAAAYQRSLSDPASRKAALPALREQDRAEVAVRASTVRAVADLGGPGVPPGSVRVRGLSSHHPLWRAGLGLTIGGALLSIGVGLPVLTVGLFKCMDVFPRCDGGMRASADATLFSGISLLVLGGAAFLTGNALWIAGGVKGPAEEVPRPEAPLF